MLFIFVYEWIGIFIFSIEEKKQSFSWCFFFLSKMNCVYCTVSDIVVAWTIKKIKKKTKQNSIKDNNSISSEVIGKTIERE